MLELCECIVFWDGEKGGEGKSLGGHCWCGSRIGLQDRIRFILLYML